MRGGRWLLPLAAVALFGCATASFTIRDPQTGVVIAEGRATAIGRSGAQAGNCKAYDAKTQNDADHAQNGARVVTVEGAGCAAIEGEAGSSPFYAAIGAVFAGLLAHFAF